MTGFRRFGSLLMLGVAAVSLLSGCGRKGNAGGPGDSTGNSSAPAAVPVEVAHLGRGPIESALRATTHLEAERAVQVRAEAAREIVALLVEEGDVVRRGQVLARLRDEQQRTALARTRGQLDRMRTEYERQRGMYAERLISEQAMANARYELEQLELALADAQRELSYTEVRAPIAGTVTQRLVKLGDNVTTGHHLFDLVDFDSLITHLFIPERDTARVRAGQPVRLSSDAAPGTLFSGTVERIAPVVDARTGTVKLTVTVPRAPGLRPGMFLQAELITAVRSDALRIPKRAVAWDGTLAFVYRVGEGETVERIPIEPELEDREWLSVAASLAEGDRVVVAGQAGLKPGTIVRVINGAEHGTPQG